MLPTIHVQSKTRILLFLAIFIALHGSVIVDVFSLDRVDLGVGMTMVSSGLAGFIVLPLAGKCFYRNILFFSFNFSSKYGSNH